MPDKTASVGYRIFSLTGMTVLFILFFIGGPDYYSPLYFKSLWNLGHIIFFALLPYCVSPWLKGRLARFEVQALLTLGVCVVFGVLIELFQYDFQRAPDIQDVIRDIIGGLVGICFLLPSRRGIRRKVLRIAQAATVCLVVLQVYPVLVAFADEYFARSRFPVLADFETPWEIERWTGSAGHSIDGAVHLSGRHSMRVMLTTDKYSGVNLFYFPGNWGEAKGLHFSVFNPSEDILPLVCRINDRKHHFSGGGYDDRFNRNYALPGGWSTIEITRDDIRNAPRGRPMDLAQVSEIGIFVVQLPHPRVMYIDDVVLIAD